MSDKNSPFRHFVCGGIGGVLSVAFGYPMDTIKVRLQTMPLPKPGEAPLYRGMMDCFRKTIKMDGFKSLFSGITAPIMVAAPVNAINFYGFAVGKKLIEKDIDHIHSLSELFAAGAFAGILASVFVAPAEHIKCLLQVHDDGGPNSKYKGTMDCLKKLYAEGGIRHVYKGTTATILRDIPASGVFFMCYESLRELVLPENASAGYDMMSTTFAGGFAGIIYWLASMPPDVLKTRLQTAPPGTYKGLGDVFRHLMATEGPRGLYTGLIPVLIRAFPVNAITCVGFEMSLKLFDWIIPEL